jgi:organic radical activating enzyme
VADAYQKAHELKVVVYNRKDLDWAEDQAKHVKPDCRLLLQPEWSRRAEATPWIIAHIQAHPDWQVSLQTHHYLQVP